MTDLKVKKEKNKHGKEATDFCNNCNLVTIVDPEYAQHFEIYPSESQVKM